MADEVKKEQEQLTDKELVKKAVEEAKQQEVEVSKTEQSKVEMQPTEEKEQKKPETTVIEPEETEEEKKLRIKKRIERLTNQYRSMMGYSKEQPISKEVNKEIEKIAEEGKTLDINTVKKLINAEVERAKQEVISNITMEEQTLSIQEERNKANAEVWERHPEVLDVDEGLKSPEEVPFYLTMQEVYKEFPELIYLPRGPIVAMEIAERRFKSNEEVKKAKMKGAEEERQRIERTSAASVVSSASVSGIPTGNTSISLSPEEQLIARKMGLTDSEYLKYKNRSPVTNKEYYRKYQGLPKPKVT
jgi:hypothetical protein